MTQAQHLEERRWTLFKRLFQRQLGINAGCHIDDDRRLVTRRNRKTHRRRSSRRGNRSVGTVSKTVARDRKPGAIRFKCESCILASTPKVEVVPTRCSTESHLLGFFDCRLRSMIRSKMPHTTIAIIDRCRRGFINTTDVWTRIDFAVKHHPYISRRLPCAMTEYTTQIGENKQVRHVCSVRLRGPCLLESVTDETPHCIWHHTDIFFRYYIHSSNFPCGETTWI